MQMLVGGTKSVRLFMPLLLVWGTACSDKVESVQDESPSTGLDGGGDGDMANDMDDPGPSRDAGQDAGQEPKPADDGGEPEGCDGVSPGASEERTRYAAAEAQVCEHEIQTRTCEEDGFGPWSGTYVASSCRELELDPECQAGGEERTRYLSPSVPYGQACESETQLRTCDDGDGTGEVWSGTFEHDTCMVEAPADCTGGVAHGQSELRVRHATATVPYGETCASEMQARACDNGSFRAWDGTFTFESCTVEAPADCGSTPHGDNTTRVRYEADSVPYGQTCVSEVQTGTCDNGEFMGWTGTFAFEVCTQAPPADCSGGVAHGQSEDRVRYLSDLVELGKSCDGPDNVEVQTHTCDNGTFGPWSGSPVTYAECFDNCGNLRHGGFNSRYRFLAPHVPWWGDCSIPQQRQRQEQRCDDGQLTPWAPTGASAEVFTYDQCTPVGEDTGCDATPDGEVETHVMYEEASVAGPESCVSESQTRTCVAGTFDDWTGTFGEPACTVQSGFAGSCLDGATNRCTDYDGSAHGSATVQSDCEAAGGVYSSMACETGAAVGHCAIGDASSLVTLHDLPPTAVLDSQEACLQLHATWAP